VSAWRALMKESIPISSAHTVRNQSAEAAACAIPQFREQQGNGKAKSGKHQIGLIWSDSAMSNQPARFSRRLSSKNWNLRNPANGLIRFDSPRLGRPRKWLSQLSPNDLVFAFRGGAIRDPRRSTEGKKMAGPVVEIGLIHLDSLGFGLPNGSL